jgi:hypothetical protein
VPVPGVAAELLMFVLFGLAVAGAAALAFFAAICWVFASCLARIPPEHRKQQPGLVYLLLIPFFPLAWNFFVFPRIAASFKSHFQARGEDVDAGEGLALAFCLLFLGCFLLVCVPYVSGLCAVGAFVTFVLMLMKFVDLKGRIPAA